MEQGGIGDAGPSGPERHSRSVSRTLFPSLEAQGALTPSMGRRQDSVESSSRGGGGEGESAGPRASGTSATDTMSKRRSWYVSSSWLPFLRSWRISVPVFGAFLIPVFRGLRGKVI